MNNVIQLRPAADQTRTTLREALDALGQCEDVVLIGRNADGTSVMRTTCDDWIETIAMMARAIEELAS